MNSVFKLLTVLILGISLNAQAQDVRTLINEGVQLHQAKDYAGAIERYKEALQIEPDNAAANYQMGFSLNASKKPGEAIPYLEKSVLHTSSTPALVATYNLMGSIYDHLAQYEKAIKCYQKGIKADSSDYALFYNLGLAYSRSEQYPEAAQSAVKALAMEPRDAEITRLYALANFHQNKRLAAVLALCNLLWLQPNGKSSGEANANLQALLKGGEIKKAAGAKKVPPLNEQNLALNKLIVNAVTEASKKQYGSPAARLGAQLQAVFAKLGNLNLSQGDSDVYFSKLSQLYYQLSLTQQVPVLAQLMTENIDKNAAAWVKSHPKEIKELNDWFANQYK